MIEDRLDCPSSRQTLWTRAPQLCKRRLPCTGKRNVIGEVIIRDGFEVLPVKERNARAVRAEARCRVLRLSVGVRKLIAHVAYTTHFTRPAAQTQLQRVVVAESDVTECIQIAERVVGIA